jgi:hypothetical protein
MDPSSGSSSTFQTLAGVLAGGLAGYVDSQNQQPFYASQPAPQTQYGLQGTGQTVGVQGSVAGISPTVLVIGVVVVVAILFLKK